MINSILKHTGLVITIILLFILFPKTLSAQSCGGSWSCLKVNALGYCDTVESGGYCASNNAYCGTSCEDRCGSDCCTGGCGNSGGGGGQACTRKSDCTYPECCNGGVCGTCSPPPPGAQCPAGSTLECDSPPAYGQCTTGRLACDAYFPSTWNPNYFCGSTGSEKNNNYKEWYGCQTNCECVYPCTLTASQPISPLDGSTQTSTNVTLVWNVPSCPNTTFEIYIGTSGPSISTMSLLATVPGSTTSVPFNTGTSGQTYYWRVRVLNSTTYVDSSAYSFTINTFTTPWWQVKDGDVTTQGSLISYVPAASLYNIAGAGGYPGIPVFGTTFNLYTNSPDRISTTRWNANSTTVQSRAFNYTYFKNLIPETIIPTVATDASLQSTGFTSDGYEWFKATGSLSLNAINFANRKVVLFVEGGDLNINGAINVTDGVGLFATFVNGNINVAGTVTGTPSIEGVYLADGNFLTGVGASQLHVRGSVASLGTTSLQRSLVVNSSPAELFEFGPDQLFLFPERLNYRRVKWAEVAP